MISFRKITCTVGEVRAQGTEEQAWVGLSGGCGRNLGDLGEGVLRFRMYFG